MLLQFWANPVSSFKFSQIEISTKMGDLNEIVVDKFKIDALFPYQRDVLQHLLDEKSVFVGQKTGKGKSLCYQAFTTAKKDSESIFPSDSHND